jgi:hypothetical protein
MCSLSYTTPPLKSYMEKSRVGWLAHFKPTCTRQIKQQMTQKLKLKVWKSCWLVSLPYSTHLDYTPFTCVWLEGSRCAPVTQKKKKRKKKKRRVLGRYLLNTTSQVDQWDKMRASVLYNKRFFGWIWPPYISSALTWVKPDSHSLSISKILSVGTVTQGIHWKEIWDLKLLGLGLSTYILNNQDVFNLENVLGTNPEYYNVHIIPTFKHLGVGVRYVCMWLTNILGLLYQIGLCIITTSFISKYLLNTMLEAWRWSVGGFTFSTLGQLFPFLSGYLLNLVFFKNICWI